MFVFFFVGGWGVGASSLARAVDYAYNYQPFPYLFYFYDDDRELDSVNTTQTQQARGGLLREERASARRIQTQIRARSDSFILFLPNDVKINTC